MVYRKFIKYGRYFIDEDNERYELTDKMLMKLLDGEMVKIKPI